jgi:hypothetical protein
VRAHAFSIAVALLAASCGSGAAAPRKGSYTLELFAYDAHIGQRIELKVKEALPGQVTLGTWSGFIRPDGTQTIVVPEVLVEGKEVRVDWYVDFDGDGAYSPPDGMNFRDHSWRHTLVGRSQGFLDTHTHDQSWVNVAPF